MEEKLVRTLVVWGPASAQLLVVWGSLLALVSEMVYGHDWEPM
jgi:hypothetical protein